MIPLNLFFLLIIIAFIFSTSTTIVVKPAGLTKFDDTGWFWFNSHEAVEYNFIKVMLMIDTLPKKNVIKVNFQ